jgi:hypothetical protein
LDHSSDPTRVSKGILWRIAKLEKRKLESPRRHKHHWKRKTTKLKEWLTA